MKPGMGEAPNTRCGSVGTHRFQVRSAVNARWSSARDMLGYNGNKPQPWRDTQMDMQSHDSEALQVVCVLTNPGMPGFVKIGKTAQQDVDMRMKQLYTTGVPFPFDCVFACKVPDAGKGREGDARGVRA
jgi:hypothetical protein